MVAPYGFLQKRESTPRFLTTDLKGVKSDGVKSMVLLGDENPLFVESTIRKI